MTDKNIKTEGDLNMSENGNSLDNENNDEVDNIINNSLSEEENIEGSIEEKTTEKEEETEESDTITNQEVDSDSDIPEEDEENSDIIDNVTDETKTTDNTNTEETEEEEDEYFSSIEDMYNSNIDVLSSVNSIKNSINERLMIRKLKLAKENDGLKLIFEVLLYFFMFFYIKSCTNNLLSQILLNYNLVEKGFIFKTTIFILKKLHIIVFLLFTNIGHIFFDILLLFFVEIIDVFVFILDRFDYDIITKEREIRGLKDNEENKDNNSNKDNSYMMIVIKGVLYIFVNGILVPLTMFLKSVNKSIAVSSNLFSKIFLSKDDILIKKQPNMDVKKSRLINSLEGKQPIKDKNINKKRSLFDRLKGKIKEYLDNIVGKNDLLTNSLRGEGKKPRNSKITSRTLGVKEAKDKSKGKNTSKGKNATKGKNKSKSGVKEEEELGGSSKETDTKGKYDISKREGKSDNNRGEVKEGNKQIEQEITTQQGNSIKSDNLNQGVSTDTTKTGDTTVVESPKPAKQAQNNFDPEKERQRQIDRKELHDLFTKGKVSDDNDNGVGGKFTKEEAQKIAEKVKERNERQQLNKEEDKSKNPDDNKKQGQSEEVDIVISDSIDTVDGGKNKGDVAKDKIDKIFKDADELIETFNEQPQKIEQINESLKKLEEIRKKSRQRENTKGLEGVQELNSQDKPGVKNEWREKFQGQTGNSKSQVRGSGRQVGGN